MKLPTIAERFTEKVEDPMAWATFDGEVKCLGLTCESLKMETHMGL